MLSLPSINAVYFIIHPRGDAVTKLLPGQENWTQINPVRHGICAFDRIPRMWCCAAFVSAHNFRHGWQTPGRSARKGRDGLEGLSPEEIAAPVYPSLTLAEVYSALAYYEDHRDEINRASVEEERFVAEFRRQHPELVHDGRPEKG
jgi:hypothetical protein